MPGVTDEQQQPDQSHQRESARLIAALALFALLVAFVIDNTRYVTVGFVFTDDRSC